MLERELRRKRARERYASMSPKKKEARKMKACVYKQQKEEYPENEHVQSFVIPHCLPFNETADNENLGLLKSYAWRMIPWSTT